MLHWSSILFLLVIACISTEELAVFPSCLEKLSSVHHIQDCNGKSLYNSMLELYKDKSENSSYDELDIKALIEKTTSELSSRLFQPRRAALEKLVTQAEDLATNYNWRKVLEFDDVTYEDAQKFKVAAEQVLDERVYEFPEKVDFNFSTVFVPVEIYKGEKATLAGIDWTNDLDQYFFEAEYKARDEPDQEDLLWQYFGSQEGFVRNYPASPWQLDEHKTNMYDARRRPWYNLAASSSKDVLILIDTSGSTVGQTQYLMQLTVQKIMDTLGEDDYVQVAKFSGSEKLNDSTRIGPRCLPSFVQATTFNKALLMHYVNNLETPNGQANYDIAVEYAFDTFDKFDSSREFVGANCSKIVIMLTDGGIEVPDIYARDPQRKVRFFTYAMGLTPTPLDAVKWLACQNGSVGYFSHINSINNINRGVQHYSDRLGEVLAQAGSPKSLLSSTYRDDWGLGMLTSLTMPVLNKTNPKNVTLLGVMALDIAINEFNKFVPHYELGPVSYTFVINHNGFVVQHPSLKTQQKWNIEPPNIDILDIETVKDETAYDSITKIRDLMIEKIPHNEVVENVGIILENDGHAAYFMSFSQDYFTENVKDTALRMAIAHPEIVNKLLQISDTNSVQVLSDLVKQNYGVNVSRWRYCDQVFKLNNASTAQEEFSLLIDNDNENATNKNIGLINHLLWDATLVNSSNIIQFVTDGDAEAISFTSAGGLTVEYPLSPGVKEPFNLESNYKDPASKKAFINYNTFIYTAKYAKEETAVEVNTTGPQITIHKALHNDADDDNFYIYGVLGVTINNTALTDELKEALAIDGQPLCNDTSRCYILDDGGFIITDNSDSSSVSNIGRWVGVVDQSLMWALFNESSPDSIYLRHKHIDYQGTCIKQWLETSSSTSVRIPTVSQLATMVLSQWNTLITTLQTSFWSWNTVEAETKLAFGQKYILCSKMSYQYYFNDQPNAQLNQTIHFSSGNCERQVMTQRLDGTNLLLVVSDLPDESCDQLTQLPQAPQKIELANYEEEDPSICKRHTRKRDAPKICAASDQEGFPYKCGACCKETVNLLLLITCFIIHRYMVS